MAEEADCLLAQVETEIVVPVELASDKREHTARTLRPKLREHLDDSLAELEPTKVEKQSMNTKADGLDLSKMGDILDDMELDRSVRPLSHLYRGGTTAAKKILEDFIKNSSTTTTRTATSPIPTTSRI